MFTGHELWVGLSHRTNQAAIDQLRTLLGPLCPVYGISMEAAGRTALHLKSVSAVTCLGGMWIALHLKLVSAVQFWGCHAGCCEYLITWLCGL